MLASSSEPLYEADVDFVDENHIDAFATALVWDHAHDEDNTTTTHESHNLLTSSLPSATSDVYTTGAAAVDPAVAAVPIPTPSTSTPPPPQLISSKSDWYPINHPLTTKTINSSSTGAYTSGRSGHRSKKKKSLTKSGDNKKIFSKMLRNEFRSSATYTLLRWPILILVLSWMLFLTWCYMWIRAYVALSEYFLTWVGKRRVIRDKLRRSTNYEEWVETAKELDEFLHLDKWSKNPKFLYYDYRTVKLTMNRLRSLRELAKDDAELIVVLQGCLKKNFAGIENRQLYSHRYYGTKDLVSQYIDEVVLCIDHVTKSSLLNHDTKKKFFKFVLKNYGKSALCLSGGACFAYTHFGIVKALLDNDLLPSIISGTSGGGIVASLACTRTDAELKKLLVPKLASKITACEDPWWVWIPRWWKTGARFDSVAWARKANFFTRGSTTFLEAFQRTGRKLNISTVPADPHSPVILCNSVTSPNCIIWSSLLASSAVPGILNPVVLMMKKPHNEDVVPFSLGNKWRDGSLRTDIPLESLNTYYNVNFSIVSQVNPHILLFFFAPKGTVGRPVASPRHVTRKEKYASLRGGFVATALEQLLKLEITKWLQMIKTLDLLPHFFEQDWLNIWLQRFSGSITIWPKIRFLDLYNILSDPSEDQLEEMILKGERCIFPSLLFIKHRLSIERAIENGRKSCKTINRVSNPLANVNNAFEISSATSRGTEAYNETLTGFANYDDDNDTDTSDEIDAESAFNLGPSNGYGFLNVDDDDDDEDDDEYIPSTEDFDEDDDATADDSDTATDGSYEVHEDADTGLFLSIFRRASTGSNRLTRRNTIY